MIDSDRFDRRNPRWLGPAISIVVAAIVATLVLSLLRVGRPQHMGTFTSTGLTLGDWTMDVDVCHTGSRQNFNGAHFYSSRMGGLACG